MVITGPDVDALATLTTVLVDERLCACGQIIGGVRSVFRWKGEVGDEAEARVALHTTVDLVDAIVARVADLHPYEVPCVLALPATGGQPAYLAWVRAETRRAGPAPS
ncbi:MAG: divalent-cation tolerance protein CutA [Actinomycetota bacterium]|nr:divalent-cation tolerance protein CutA [Actinomycetota bacterium]